MSERERCRCGLELDPKPPDDRRYWWPESCAEPPTEVRAVARYGPKPEDHRIRRLPIGLWLDNLQVKPWRETGLCQFGNCHLVVRMTIY